MTRRKVFRLKLRKRTIVLGHRTLVMGVLNVTPDSFSDGGRYGSVARAVARAREIERAGADLIDIGAESTRPGATELPASEELSRLLPVLKALRGRLEIPISIDTRKSSVAEAALAAGAEIVNDISGLNYDPRLAEVVAQQRAGLVLMHMRGTPRTMQKGPFAKNVLAAVTRGLGHSIRAARRAGVRKQRLILDPGIGFGKSYAQNFELLSKLGVLGRLGYPLLVGSSRKAFIGAALAKGGQPLAVGERLWGTAATVVASVLAGAHIVRVHDVREMVEVCRISDQILAASERRWGLENTLVRPTR